MTSLRSSGSPQRAAWRPSLTLPYLVCTVIAAATLAVDDDPLIWQVGAAFTIQALIGVGLWRGYEGRGGHAVHLTGIALYLASIALLRDGLGSTFGYGTLAFLPVAWAALNGKRLELVVALAGMTLLLVVPAVLVGGPTYPPGVWRAAALLVTLGASFGVAVLALMRRLQVELDRSEAILASMSEGLGVTRDGEIVTVNRALSEMTGLTEEQLIGQRPPFSFWPTERHDATEALRRGVVDNDGGEFELELTRADGERFPASITATPIDLGDGSRAFLNTVRDITAQRAHDDALQRHADQLEAIAEVTRAIGHSDPRDSRDTLCRVALQVCDGAHAVSIWEPGPEGRLVATTVHPDVGVRFSVPADTDRHGASVVFGSGEPLFVPDARVSEFCDRRIVQVLGSHSVHFHPIADTSGIRGVLAVNWPDRVDRLPDAVLPVLGVLADEAALALQRAELLAQLDELTRTDQLTGLPNRRAWDDVVTREMEHALRRRRPLTVAMLDLDHFKAYNDAHGHVRGDTLLRTAAHAWRSRLRGSDVIARWGGEEFALLLPDCTEDDAVGLVERLRGALPDAMTFSAGIATWDGDADPSRLIDAADHALYRAKARGRDRLERAGDPVAG